MEQPNHQSRVSVKEYVIVFFLKITALMPLSINRLIGAAFGWAAILFGSQIYRVSQINLSICFPNLLVPQQKRLARASVLETCKLAMEAGSVWLRDYPWLKSKIKHVNNEEIFDKALAEEKGVILLVPHLGNWEVLGLYIAELNAVTVMYQPPEMKVLEAIMRSGREKNNITLVPTNRRGVMAILKILKQGGLTSILPDQVPDPSSGSEVIPFYGYPALTMTLLNSLRKSSDCLVVAAFAKRVRGGFEINFLPADDGIYSNDDTESLAAMNRTIESCINQIPEQYQWEYKRFRRLPDAVRDIYKR